MKINNELVDYKNRNFYSNWEEVVYLGVDLLVKKNKATKELAKKIIELTKKIGVYYIIAPGLALLHAEPGPWSKKPGISLMVLEKEVEFGFTNTKKAKIILTLSSPDGDSHMDIIADVMNLLQKEDMIENLKKCGSKKEIISLINLEKGDASLK